MSLVAHQRQHREGASSESISSGAPDLTSARKSASQSGRSSIRAGTKKPTSANAFAAFSLPKAKAVLSTSHSTTGSETLNALNTAQPSSPTGRATRGPPARFLQSGMSQIIVDEHNPNFKVSNLSLMAGRGASKYSQLEIKMSLGDLQGASDVPLLRLAHCCSGDARWMSNVKLDDDLDFLRCKINIESAIGRRYS
jgi:hypothetical protein